MRINVILKERKLVNFLSNLTAHNLLGSNLKQVHYRFYQSFIISFLTLPAIKFLQLQKNKKQKKNSRKIQTKEEKKTHTLKTKAESGSIQTHKAKK